MEKKKPNWPSNILNCSGCYQERYCSMTNMNSYIGINKMDSILQSEGKVIKSLGYAKIRTVLNYEKKRYRTREAAGKGNDQGRSGSEPTKMLQRDQPPA